MTTMVLYEASGVSFSTENVHNNISCNILTLFEVYISYFNTAYAFYVSTKCKDARFIDKHDYFLCFLLIRLPLISHIYIV